MDSIVGNMFAYDSVSFRSILRGPQGQADLQLDSAWGLLVWVGSIVDSRFCPVFQAASQTRIIYGPRGLFADTCREHVGFGNRTSASKAVFRLAEDTKRLYGHL